MSDRRTQTSRRAMLTGALGMAIVGGLMAAPRRAAAVRAAIGEKIARPRPCEARKTLFLAAHDRVRLKIFSFDFHPKV